MTTKTKNYLMEKLYEFTQNKKMNKTKRELYIKTWNEKWSKYQKKQDKIPKNVFSICPFCENSRENRDTSLCMVSGSMCSKYCLIDKKICGSKKSLMYQLMQPHGDGNYDQTWSLIKKIVKKIKKKAGK